MNDKISDEVLDSIIDQVNAAIDIPFLNEKQERLLFAFVLSVVISAFIKTKAKPKE